MNWVTFRDMIYIFGNKMNHWSRSSLYKLQSCHSDLVLIADRVLQIHDASVICGYRNKIEQNKALKDGFSKVEFPDSLHNVYPSAAIDIGPYVAGKNVLYDPDHCRYFAGIFMATANFLYETDQVSHRIRWGGDWDGDNDQHDQSFNDLVHFELIGVRQGKFNIYT